MVVLEVLEWRPIHFLETRLEAGDPVPVLPQLSFPVDVKSPFDLDRAIRSVRGAVRPFPKAALFALVEEGFRSPFELLTACIISIRTRDEVSLPAAQRLFELARTPEAMSRLDPQEIEQRIRPAAFSEGKAAQILDISRRIMAEHSGQMPCEEASLLAFRGVGPKCANLVLGIACGRPRIGVDIHVHRVTNRWGYVHARAPELTMQALEAKLPRPYWVEINALLVPFGKHICTGSLPQCSTCVVLDMCRQVGVEKHR